MEPILLRSDDPWTNAAVHDVEAFGPVSTVMPYRDMTDAIALANRGMGSLALSLFTHSPEVAREFIQGAAAFHGRMLVLNRDNAAESTGHGSPLPVLVHGGPGRAGGSEEMGGVRGVKHYMQRTAIQSTPAMIAAISGVMSFSMDALASMFAPDFTNSSISSTNPNRAAEWRGVQPKPPFTFAPFSMSNLDNSV